MNLEAMDLTTLRAIGAVLAVGVLFLVYPSVRRDPREEAEAAAADALEDDALPSLAELLEEKRQREREEHARALADQEARTEAALRERRAFGVRLQEQLRQRQAVAEQRERFRRGVR